MAKRDDDQGSGISGKRTRSWREIDARSGKSKYHSRHEDRDQQKLERSSTYQRYKTAADSLFTGGELPDELQKKFDPEGKRKAQKDAMLNLREMDRKTWVQGVVEFVEKYPELPDDPYFLDSLLDHPRDRIVDKSLARLEALEEEGRLKAKVPGSLAERLKSIELTSTDPDLQSRARTLRAKIRG